MPKKAFAPTSTFVTETGNHFISSRRTIMKSTGIVRKVDELGRIVVPMELRKTMDIKEKDPIEIFTDGDSIILRKYTDSCIFCGNADDVRRFEGKIVCKDCLDKLKSI